MAIVVYITCPEKDAERLSQQILEARLAACINQVPQVISRYWWDGQIQKDIESLLIVKTTVDALSELKECLKEWHPYDVPEIISLAIQDGSPAYLHWLHSEVGKKT
ncbi:MAG: divalent-cation tolerance protein CutA [Planctomycetota bacterium]